MILIYAVGTAGSGKSTLTKVFDEWMDLQRYDSLTVNLDPGVERLNYAPDIDIRDWVSLEEIMDTYNLGPNGAQVVACDMVALQTNKIHQEIERYDTDYVLIDTPGQIELFAFREASKKLIEDLGAKRSMINFLFDPILAKEPAGFVSLVMLSATVQFRLNLPIINVLAKSDMLTDEDLKKVLEWSKNAETLYAHLSAKELQEQLSLGFFKVLEDMGVYRVLTPTSAEQMTGLEDLYNVAQQVFMGGEDLEKR